MTIEKKSDELYTEQEAQRRAEAALRAAFNAWHKPQSEMKVGKKAKAQPTATMKRRSLRKKKPRLAE